MIFNPRTVINNYIIKFTIIIYYVIIVGNRNTSTFVHISLVQALFSKSHLAKTLILPILIPSFIGLYNNTIFIFCQFKTLKSQYLQTLKNPYKIRANFNLVTCTGINTVNFAGTLILQGFLLLSMAKTVSKYHLFPTFLSEIEVFLQQKQDQNKIKILILPKWCQIH